jgi:hypothetical protein
MRSLDRYDVIEADALRPHNAYAGNLYSQEYFELLRSRLRPGGIAVTWAPTARIRATFRTVFPHVLAFRTILLGSQEPLHFDAASFWQRVEQPAIAGRFLAAGVPLADLLRRHMEVPPVALGAEVAQGHMNDLNHDLFPRDEYLVPSR